MDCPHSPFGTFGHEKFIGQNDSRKNPKYLYQDIAPVDLKQGHTICQLIIHGKIFGIHALKKQSHNPDKKKPEQRNHKITLVQEKNPNSKGIVGKLSRYPTPCPHSINHDHIRKTL
jgi:hypothetical protein